MGKKLHTMTEESVSCSTIRKLFKNDIDAAI